jgi:glycosyltransferase involved in cell wall biosynthesis
MRWWNGREIEELKTAQLVIVISQDEERKLLARGVERTLWSPPLVEPADLPDSDRVGLVGSLNPSNREGLRWLEQAGEASLGQIRVYGSLATAVRSPLLSAVGRYEDLHTPYRDCGIVLMATSEGMGVQIKAVEALACGRAIVARRSAMRGLPPSDEAWIEVSTPEAMIETASRLQHDAAARSHLAAAAREYYRRHLDHRKISGELREAYSRVAREGAPGGSARGRQSDCAKRPTASARAQASITPP